MLDIRKAAALRWADFSSKQFYRLYIRTIIWELILDGNRPECLIHQGRGEEEQQEEE
jgi:hypothetical protein